ncbi:hypothetical protein [Rubrivirga sp. IMCC43871]|uniref:hypothetical protein n=1 Tax=Rubrivirga sp. IMCC43871 TaxID=3391575 RepID=UPI00398FDAE6
MSRTRTLLRFALAVAMAASTQGFLFVQASFTANQDWIAETLCVNRDRPERKCDGMCVLKERMGQHHDHEHAPGTPAELDLALSIRPMLADAPRLAPPPVTVAARSITATLADATGTSGDVFRPPRQA